jgi:hypothetical protein
LEEVGGSMAHSFGQGTGVGRPMLDRRDLGVNSGIALR